jgi:hypothetical protein
MNYSSTVQVYEAMKAGDADLLTDVLRAAIRYSQIRAEWMLMTIEERREVDARRTAAHNAFIDALNILSRAMKKAGQDNEWRRLLGDDRKEIGDFACFLVAHLGILAR